MNLEKSSEDQAFANEVRAFLDENLPEEKRYEYTSIEHSEKDVMLWWHEKLAAKGWLVPAWPSAFGGPGWTLGQRYIFQQECQKAGAPQISIFGPLMVGPVIYTFGSAAQKERFLPGIEKGTELWCQGYSEPGAGSDLASLKTRADRDGDAYIVNGQKIWTTQAHWADWIFCLVRTDWDVKAQEGISFLLIDMNTPGIEVRPIVSIDGLHHLNEVYFTDVRVPIENLVGEENKGWTYAKFLLEHERGGIANTAESRAKLDRLRQMASSQTSFSEPLIEDPSFANRLSDLEMRLAALEITEARALSAPGDSFDAVKLALPLKLLGTQLQQDIADLCVELVGYGAAPYHYEAPKAAQSNQPSLFEAGPKLVQSQFFGRASTIYGGTSEIQKNIMTKIVLQV